VPEGARRTPIQEFVVPSCEPDEPRNRLSSSVANGLVVHPLRRLKWLDPARKHLARGASACGVRGGTRFATKSDGRFL
jgi:hypothetical protein